MGKDYPHSVRIYRGGVIVGFVHVSDSVYELFNDMLSHDGELRPIINMVDELYPGKPKSEDRYEFQKVVGFDLVGPEE